MSRMLMGLWELSCRTGSGYPVKLYCLRNHTITAPCVYCQPHGSADLPSLWPTDHGYLRRSPREDGGGGTGQLFQEHHSHLSKCLRDNIWTYCLATLAGTPHCRRRDRGSAGPYLESRARTTSYYHFSPFLVLTPTPPKILVLDRRRLSSQGEYAVKEGSDWQRGGVVEECIPRKFQLRNVQHREASNHFNPDLG